jgi:Domain of unknown function (DUF4920)
MTRKVILLATTMVLALPALVSAAEPAKTAPPVADSKSAETFGAPVTAGETLSLADVLAASDRYAGKQVRVEGVVRSACTKKGCWMELASADGKGPGCRVTFKDYGFFVPRDAAGAAARLEGTLQVKALAKKEVDHLEAEGAKFAKAEDGTAKEFRIVATGVELRR